MYIVLMYFTKNNSFTLIELLVVVSIIGLFSSVVLSQLNTAREKARLNAGKYFVAQVNHSSADSAVAIYEFDECSGTTVKDLSGSNSDAYFHGVVTWSTDTPSGKGCSVSFSTGSGVVINDTNSSIDIGLGSATRMLWFKTNSNIPQGLIRKSDGNNINGFLISLENNGVYVKFHYSPYVGNIADVKYRDDAWHHVAVVLDRVSNKSSLYFDGKLVHTSDAISISSLDLNANTHTIIPSSYYDFSGKIDSVHFYNKNLSAKEVNDVYVMEGGEDKFVFTKWIFS